ncbi:major facilitator superfamily domain-containing protein [Mycena haematopus]|nr:major facilitator superfamily domain-containing protein [Mycena haematopus]
MARDLNISVNVAILGLSLYVFGFGLGPAFVLLLTLAAYTAFQLEGCLGGRNIYALLSCRFFTGIFGSSPLTNAPSQIADIWNARERGLAIAIYSAMPFLGPIIGPIVGGYVVMKVDWHFNFWLMFIFSVLSPLSGAISTPETYAPVLLRRRANNLTRESNGIVLYVPFTIAAAKKPSCFDALLSMSTERCTRSSPPSQLFSSNTVTSTLRRAVSRSLASVLG